MLSCRTALCLLQLGLATLSPRCTRCTRLARSRHLGAHESLLALRRYFLNPEGRESPNKLGSDAPFCRKARVRIDHAGYQHAYDGVETFVASQAGVDAGIL